MPKDKICLVVGAGDDTGMAIARAFAEENYHVVIESFLLLMEYGMQ